MTRDGQKPFSMRLDERTMSRLDAHGRRRGESRTRLAARLIEEGLRTLDHPSIVFRNGPTGRRAALAGGPDVWEVITTLRSTGKKGEDAIAATAARGSLTLAQVRAALAYYGEYREEIDDRIRLNEEAADREYKAWQRAQAALA